MREYPDLEQGSDAWLQARCGIVTASTVGKLITPTLRTASNDTSRALILTLAAERITGQVEPVFVSADMERGTLEEPFAKAAYEQANGVEVVDLGFVTEDKWGFTLGFSPDGLVGSNGLVEVKSRRAKNHIKVVLDGEVPKYHLAQIQTGLLVTGREWADYIDYSNGMHLFVSRVYPDERWFNAITEAAMAAEEAIRDIVSKYEAAIANMPATERIPDLDDIEVA